MILWRKKRISDKQHQSLILIYEHRGLTNEHLRILLFGHLDSDPVGQKANVSRYSAGLRKMKMIESNTCYPYSKELIHCLTLKGIEYVKEKVVIDPGHEDAGFDHIHYGDFDASMLKPGLKNLEHTMMYLDFVIKHKDKLMIRHNLYSVQEYKYLNSTSNVSSINTSAIMKKGKVRPDGEIKERHSLFALEIDTGSERYPQLVSKFDNYKRYLDYCVENDQKTAWKGVLFVCKESKLQIEKDQRIHTILRAASEGLKHYCWTFVVQIYRGHSFTLGQLLKEKQELLSELNIPAPSKENPVLVEKQRREEEERKQKEEAAFMIQQNILKQQEAERERQRKLDEERRRLQEEEEKKKSGFFGKLFS